VQVGVTMALMVGALQVAAGALRLGAVVDYISSPVVLGYITGAGVLIGAGQLHNLTHTSGPGGNLVTSLTGWVEVLGDASGLSVALGLGTLALVVLLRVVNRKIPGAIIAMSGGIAADLIFDLQGRGIMVVADISPVPAGLPPLTLPSLSLVNTLAPAAVAATVLSLVESSSLARSIAGHTGQKLSADAEFIGQGLANVAAAFTGGYPVSGSLSRSVLNEKVGARSRLAGVFAGVALIVVLLAAGPLVDHTPIACLAGLLLLVAWDLVDVPRIKEVFRTRWSDGLAFAVTMVGCWVMNLDKAIYLGVGISLVLFLRRARLLVVRDLAMDREGRLREVDVSDPAGEFTTCDQIRVLHVEGSLFFGAAGELRDTLEEAARDPQLKALIVRVKRTSGLDATTADALSVVAEAMRARGQRLLLVGMRPQSMAALEGSGAAARVGRENLFPTQPTWFAAMRRAVARALEMLDEEQRARCPLARLVTEPGEEGAERSSA
jgi:SulP family sulfate permease